MASVNSPTRRVLGYKTTNAPVRKQSPHKAANTQPAKRVGVVPLSNDAQLHSLHPSNSLKVGQKRRIEEVDDVERNDSLELSQRSDGTQTLSLLSGGSSEAGEMSLDVIDCIRPTNTTSALSFGTSQQEPGPMETTFEIHDEVMSQNSRDQMHAITLPQNASQPLGAQPALFKDLSQVSVGMSSFVNFDQITSSQDDGMEPIKQDGLTADEPAAQATPKHEQSRRGTMDAQAECLRTRLQLAFFKVQTNQASVPFSRLRPISRSKSPGLSANTLSSSPPASPPAHRPSPETRVAIMRARATMQKKSAVKSLDQLPIPRIAPTAFSARDMAETSLDPQLPSSPPRTHESLSNHSSAEFTNVAPTPLAKSASIQMPPLTPMQLSSPPGSPEHGRKSTTTGQLKKREREERYNGLTSSVIKGDAANSLLDLMKANAQDD